jgi:hypothetical protein
MFVGAERIDQRLNAVDPRTILVVLRREDGMQDAPARQRETDLLARLDAGDFEAFALYELNALAQRLAAETAPSFARGALVRPEQSPPGGAAAPSYDKAREMAAALLGAT